MKECYTSTRSALILYFQKRANIREISQRELSFAVSLILSHYP